MAGYSATPLAKKLGIKPGQRIMLVNAPEHYFQLFDDLPAGLDYTENGSNVNFIHFFTKNAAELNDRLPALKQTLKIDGMIWVSWPKKASGVTTDVSEQFIRDIAISCGLVDIKVCAVDEIWSGLKLVIPVKNRK